MMLEGLPEALCVYVCVCVCPCTHMHTHTFICVVGEQIEAMQRLPFPYSFKFPVSYQCLQGEFET